MRLRLLATALTFALLAFATVAGVSVVRSRPSDPIAAAAAPHGYSLVRWELRHLPGQWLYRLGSFLRGGPSAGHDDDATLSRYFALNEKAKTLERLEAQGEPGAQGELEAVRRQRQALENRVEKIIEERIGKVLAAQRLTTSPPLFGGIDIVFPPVNIEFDGSPRVLAISPRERIALERSYLLRREISVAEVQRLEAEAEATGVSALVDVTGGVATYPSVIDEGLSYASALELAAHEWVHQFLFFRSLGRRYFRSVEMRTINETVANIAGREIARLVGERFPQPSSARPPGVPARTIDYNREMRQLRLAVDGLLALGRVEEAEALMEVTRLTLAEHGFYLRKINQAFFAFRGTYADTAASSSPIGPKVQAVRQRSPSLGAFLRTMAQIGSSQDLDRLLAQMRATSVP